VISSGNSAIWGKRSSPASRDVISTTRKKMAPATGAAKAPRISAALIPHLVRARRKYYGAADTVARPTPMTTPAAPNITPPATPDRGRGREVRAKAQLVAGATGRKQRGVEDRIDAEQPAGQGEQLNEMNAG
jgi:hypothetical protein